LPALTNASCSIGTSCDFAEWRIEPCVHRLRLRPKKAAKVDAIAKAEGRENARNASDASSQTPSQSSHEGGSTPATNGHRRQVPAQAG
jgi:hypothetical protein